MTISKNKIKLKYIIVAITLGLAILGYWYLNNSARTGLQLLEKQENDIADSETSICTTLLEDEKLDPVITFDGEPAPVNFAKFPEAKEFYTVITKAAAAGPNYAGHFTFISWGCGTNCFQFALVDSITGDFVAYNPYPTTHAAYPPAFNINSKLLIFNDLGAVSDYKGKSQEEIIEQIGFLAGVERAYYVVEEWENDHTWLNKVCSENVLEGI